MSNQVNSMNKGLTVKDLVTTGIFTALLFVFVLVGGVFFATNPSGTDCGRKDHRTCVASHLSV